MERMDCLLFVDLQSLPGLVTICQAILKGWSVLKLQFSLELSPRCLSRIRRHHHVLIYRCERNRKTKT